MGGHPRQAGGADGAHNGAGPGEGGGVRPACRDVALDVRGVSTGGGSVGEVSKKKNTLHKERASAQTKVEGSLVMEVLVRLFSLTHAVIGAFLFAFFFCPESGKHER